MVFFTAIMFNASRTLTNYGKQHGWIRVQEVKDQITVLGRDLNTGVYAEQDIQTLIDNLRV